MINNTGGLCLLHIALLDDCLHTVPRMMFIAFVNCVLMAACETFVVVKFGKVVSRPFCCRRKTHDGVS